MNRHSRTAIAVFAAALVSGKALQAQTVQITINSKQQAKAISPYIYGSNSSSIAASTFDRVGGNRWTAYNWENNASNAGNDYHFNNDGYATKDLPADQQDVPGAAVLPSIQTAAANNRGLILTIPTAGYVSQTKPGGGAGGDVRKLPNYLQDQFNQGVAKKGSAFSTTPNAADDFVYQDEFVNWIQTKRAKDQPIFYSLDNEPDLWSGTHNEVHPNPVTYQETVDKTKSYGAAIKDVQTDALIFGPVNYGWQGIRNLQSAPDGAGRNFQQYYLAQMKLAEEQSGRRLMDVLDVHWYSEARGNDGNNVARRVNDYDASNPAWSTSPGVVAARLQAPRSLWDSTYIENSWIKDTLPAGDQAIRLLGRMQQDVSTYYPGTKLGVTEYNWGGGGHISGGLAQADSLGIFGREGVFAANWWELGGGSSFVNAAFNLFRNFDGAGKKFGDTSISAGTSDVANTSVYASVDANNPGRMVIVLINKSGTATTANVALTIDQALQTGHVYQLTGASANIAHLADIQLADPKAFTYVMPAMSVTTIELVPEPATIGLLAAVGVVALTRRGRRVAAP